MFKSLLIVCLLLGCLAGQTVAQTVLLSGAVRNFHSQRPVPFATLSVKKIVKRYVNGAYMNDRVDFTTLSTDSVGTFSVKLPVDEYVVESSAVGYSRKSKYINLRKSEQLLLELNEQTNQLDDVEVKTKRAEDNVRSVEASVVKLNVQNIKKLPIVFGEGDLIKALTLQPGVTTVGEGAGGFNVRGGRVDQNLVLLDDAPLFNTSHLLGLFTSINAEAVQNATLYKAVMPARYGGRLSALLNITTKTNTTEPKRAVGAGPVSANGLWQQPFQNGSILLSGRVAYPDLILGALPRRFRGSSAFFYDLNGAFQYRFSARNSLKITGYHSQDSFKFPEDTSYAWTSTAATMQYSSLLTERLSVNVKGILSHYTYGVDGLGNGLEYELRATNRHHEGRLDLLYQLPQHRLEAGGGVVLYRFSPGRIDPAKPESAIVAQSLSDEQGREASAYVADEWTLGRRVSVQAGVRYAQFQNVSSGDAYNYVPNQPRTVATITDTVRYVGNTPSATYGGQEPRVSLKLELTDNQSIKAGYARTRQFIHLISNTTAISPIDYWKLSGRYVAPQVADQFSLGYYRNFLDNTFETYVEGFYKDMTQLVDYKDGASLLLNPHLETELLPAVGRAYGVEVSLQKNKGRFTGNASYTWSRSVLAVRSGYVAEQVNGGAFYPSLFDKPHNLALTGQYFLGKGWTFASTFVYQTGRPITYPDGQYSYNTNLIYNYSRRNADRLPDFHRLDVSFSYDSRRNKTQRTYNILNISFYNVYARQNPYSIYFRQFINVSRAYQLAVLGTIVPSITLTKYW
jgi:outer membrane receptor protein involved in Fe transport